MATPVGAFPLYHWYDKGEGIADTENAALPWQATVRLVGCVVIWGKGLTRKLWSMPPRVPTPTICPASLIPRASTSTQPAPLESTFVFRSVNEFPAVTNA